jgi:hypothetical protein
MTPNGEPLRSALAAAGEKINAALERSLWRWATLFTGFFLICSLIVDARKKMWIDEILTLLIARQPGPGEIVKAIMEGADGQPPTYALIVHWILPFVRNATLAVRLPATLGFCCMPLFILAFCRRRLPASFAVAASLLALYTCRYYATEGRGYGIVFGCAAGALFAWQTAAEGRHRVPALALLTLFLAVMPAMHYYAIFFLIPLFFAELVRWHASGKLDLAVLAAMVPAPLILGLHYPLIVASKRFQLHFWSPAAWGMIPDFYDQYLVPLCALCLPALVVFALLRKTPDSLRVPPADIPWHERVVIGGLALMPPLVIALSKYTTHVFVDRYILWVIPGFATLTSAVLCGMVRRQATAGLILMGLLVGLIGLREVHQLSSRWPLLEAEAFGTALEALPDSSEPIAVADAHIYMELAYYLEPRLRERLVYLKSPDRELRYFGRDTDSLLLSAPSLRAKLRVVDYEAFIVATPRCIVAALPRSYVPLSLAISGYRITPLGRESPPLLYEAEVSALTGR